jgi:DNA (cytosine-5)-methyltransferase 1
MKKIRLATVFSGIGSVEHAFLRLNIPHEIVFACDVDKYCKKSYFANYEIKEEQWFEDINTLDGKPFKNKVDLFVGGSPCQSFSMVGKRKGLEDKRGILIFEFIRLVTEIQPEVFIFENVRGLLNHDGGNTFKCVLEEFEATGYSIQYQVLNAKDYGIPQNRERLFLVGCKNKNRKFEFPSKLPLLIKVRDLLEDTPNPKYFLPPKGIAFVTDPKNLKKSYTQINGDIALCETRNQQFNWHGDFIMEEPKEIDDKYFLSENVKKYVLAEGTKNFHTRPKTDLDIARPLLSTMGKMHRAGVDNYFTYGARIRKLTPRECLRIMGFDDRFKIVCSDTQMYKQAGNSIVSTIFIEILKALYNI